MTMNIQDRIDCAMHTLHETVGDLGAESMSLRVSGEVFATLLVLFDVHEVSVGYYTHRDARFLQMPSQRVDGCYVSVSTDDVPGDLPPDVRKSAVEWGGCPDCGEVSFVYAATIETAVHAAFLFGMELIEVVRPS